MKESLGHGIRAQLILIVLDVKFPEYWRESYIVSIYKRKGDIGEGKIRRSMLSLVRS